MKAEEWIQENLKNKIKGSVIIISEKIVSASGGKETISIEIDSLASQYRKLLEDATISDADKAKAINEILYPTPAKVEIQDISDSIIEKIKGI